MTNPFVVLGVMVPDVNSVVLLSPWSVVARSNGEAAAPVMSYKLNIISPIPVALIETVIPLKFGDVDAFAAYTICADTTPASSTILADAGSDQLFPRESVTLVASGPAAL